jgi:hypothetical protein
MANKVGRPKKVKEETAILHTENGPVVLSLEETKGYEPIPALTNEPGAVNESVPEMNANAYSITRDPETQKWMAISIPYDVKSGTVGKIVVVEQNTDRQIIMERFQILAGQEFMSS